MVVVKIASIGYLGKVSDIEARPFSKVSRL